ncbi:MAG: hypothetical protein ABIL11_07985 [Chloroflexota bacterium]
MRPSLHFHKWISLIIVGMLIFVFASSVAARTETRRLAAPYAQTDLLESITIISSADFDTCGITANGKVTCWGSTTLIQEGEELSNAVALTSGFAFHCALTDSGGVKCWGTNNSGNLGDGTTEHRNAAVDVKGLTSGVVAIDAGFGHVCAVLRGGGVKCWGQNTYGQLGDGTEEDRYTPVNVSGVSDAVGVAAGWGHTCILTKGGSVRCWGNNTYRQLGNGTHEESAAPVEVIGLSSGVSAIAAQKNHTCVLMENGGVKCWGDNDEGQLGDGTTTDRDAPVNVIGLSSSVTALAFGDAHTCALTSAGGMKCWGDNRSGQLGDGTNEDRLSPVDVAGLTSGVTAISAGTDYSCAVTDAGPMCWGENSFDHLGLGIETNQLTPIDPVGLSRGVENIAAGHGGTCAVQSDGRVLCWGDNFSQQLADGTNVDRDLPIEVRGLPQGVQTVAVGSMHICALTEAGTVWCWGANYSGQLGNESVTQFGGPVVVTSLESGVKAIAAGEEYACAITENGGLKCWGDNLFGQLGDGTNDDRETPVDVPGLTNGVVAVAAAGRNTCVLTNGGAVKCWGANYNGQLGNGTSEQSNRPVDVSGLTAGVTAITVGDSHACALMADGGIKCWGEGPLGNGTHEESPVPVDVAGLAGRTIAIAAGSSHTCALIEGGSIQCWGYNIYGELGDGSSNLQETPVSVSGLSGGVIAITAGNYHTCALTTGGGMKCWGQNAYGQLGNGDGADQNTPQPVISGEAVTVRLYVAEAGGFREGGPLVPEITTYIPSPLDVSTEPAVIGTNLFLAALMMLPFAVAAEFFTRTLAENEETLKRRFRPVNWFSRLQERLAGFFGQCLGKTRFGDILKVVGVMLFYGLVFSLLDKTWNPFSLKGLILFLSMTIAYGVVGVADDIVQWRRIRRWGLPAELKIRPTNMLLAAISMATTRILSLVPGLMFGTPEALETDEKQFDEPKRNTLLKISLLTFTVIGLAVWLPTAVTGLLLKLSLPEIVSTLLGGVEAFLLVIFAVALENLFVQMLGFPGSFGQSLKRRSRWLWIGLLVLVTFVFYHTLINPRGELAEAISQANVILFFVITGIFIIVSLIMHLYFRGERWRAVAKGELPPSAVGEEEKVKAVPAPAIAEAPTPATMVAVPTMAETPATTGETKTCPSCGQAIKLEARICRFCHAEFEVKARGYCLNCHDVVDVEKGNCTRCGNEAADVHFESTFLKAPPRPAPPPTTARSAPSHGKNRWIVAIASAIGICLIVVAAVILAIGGSMDFASLISPATPTSMPTPTRTHRPTATPDYTATQQRRNENATATVQASWEQGFAQPILNDVRGRQPNFEDDFSVMSGRFVRWSDITAGVTFGDGVMHLNTTGTNWSAGGGSLIATDFVLKYEFTPVTIGSDSAVCSNFRSSNAGGYNFCVVLSDDWWGMGGLPPGGDYYTILEGGSNGVSAYHTTRITIIARGDEFAFYIDDRLVGYTKDDSYHGNWVDIGVWTPNDVAAVDVDNVQFWDLNNLLP